MCKNVLIGHDIDNYQTQYNHWEVYVLLRIWVGLEMSWGVLYKNKI